VTATAQTAGADPQSIYYMSLVVQAQADNTPDGPLHSALNQLVASVQAQILQRGSGAGSSSAGGDLSTLYGAERCEVCGDKVLFQPHSDDSGTAEGSAVNSGGSVLHGSCAGCGVRTERCCYSLRLVTTSSVSPANSATAGGVDGRLVACPVCEAVTSAALAGSAEVGSSGHSAHSAAGSALLCPYCGVLMHPL
jgi:DNA-directed RNA polymerase subunit RPC12/RpoP